MKKISVMVCIVLVLIDSVYAMDIEQAKKVITDYSYINRETYIPAILDYGFTEKQVKAWRVTGTFLGSYIQQLASILNGYGDPDPETAITTIKNTGLAMGDLSEQGMVQMERFIRDLAAMAIQLRDAALASRDAQQQQIATASQQGQEQTKAAEERLKAEYDRFVKETQEAQDATHAEQEEQRRIAAADMEANRIAEEKYQQRQKEAAERRKQELRRYAESFGLIDYIDEGLIVTQAQITPANFDLAKKALIIPEANDLNYTVNNIIGKYVIYTAVIRGNVYQIALLAEKGKIYPSGSKFDIRSVYQITGVERFSRALGGNVDIIVIERKGENPFY